MLYAFGSKVQGCYQKRNINQPSPPVWKPETYIERANLGGTHLILEFIPVFFQIVPGGLYSVLDLAKSS